MEKTKLQIISKICPSLIHSNNSSLYPKITQIYIFQESQEFIKDFQQSLKRKHRNKEFKTSVLNSLPLTVAHQYSILRAHLNFHLLEW